MPAAVTAERYALTGVPIPAALRAAGQHITIPAFVPLARLIGRYEMPPRPGAADHHPDGAGGISSSPTSAATRSCVPALVFQSLTGALGSWPAETYPCDQHTGVSADVVVVTDTLTTPVTGVAPGPVSAAMTARTCRGAA
jgi:hypothetical protein